MEFLHNTKITGSAINEKRKHDIFRDRSKPQGRAISLMEITATLLGYPQVYTDIKFIHIPTIPLAERCSVEKESTVNKVLKESNFRTKDIDDYDSGDIIPQYYVRNIVLKNEIPIWRQYSTSESLVIKDQMFSNLSIDPVTAFGMRPPELRFVRHIKMYYKWFYFKNSNMHRNTFSKQVCNLEKIIKQNIIETMWIDGCGRYVYIRPVAIADVLTYFGNREWHDFYSNEQVNSMFRI